MWVLRKICNSARAAVHRSPQWALILASERLLVARHSEQVYPPRERRYVARHNEQFPRLASDQWDSLDLNVLEWDLGGFECLITYENH